MGKVVSQLYKTFLDVRYQFGTMQAKGSKMRNCHLGFLSSGSGIYSFPSQSSGCYHCKIVLLSIQN